jgi:hypothetical protein
MSDAIIFIIGSGVFAITTTATLLYGYSWFADKSVEAGIEVEDDFTAEIVQLPVNTNRVHRNLGFPSAG